MLESGNGNRGKKKIMARYRLVALLLVSSLAIKPLSLSAGEREQTVENTLGMKLRLIPAGPFKMGTPESEIERLLKAFPDSKRKYFADESPAHPVRITQPFYLGIHEVTVGQFRKFVEAAGYKTELERGGFGGVGWNESKGEVEYNPKYNWRSPGFLGLAQTDEHPVVHVTWNDAVAFCKWLSGRESVTYRLPTEAEWEYACRAGTTTWYQHGDDTEGLARVGNVADGTLKEALTKYQGRRGWRISGRDGYAFTAPVGRFQANGFGLYDMHGNVEEWCADWHGEKYYGESPRNDPQGPSDDFHRVVRGGSWGSDANSCRSACRFEAWPVNQNHGLGFRVAGSLSGK